MARYTLRDDDLIARIDDQLVMVLIGASAEDGRAVGERLCAAVRVHQFGDDIGVLTVSVGAAAAPDHGHQFDEIVNAASSALARVRTQGKDGTAVMPLSPHEGMHRPLSIDRFAGRAQEQTSLIKWMEEAAHGQPRFVSVTGEAGLGTATLLRQLESEVRLSGGLFAMAASPNLAVRKPYGVWQALLKTTYRHPAALAEDWQELHNLESSLRAPRGVIHTGSQYRLLGELTSYVRGLASKQHAVIVLDEMQWADSTSWDALEHLLTRLDTDRLMICIAQRPDSGSDFAPQRQMLQRLDIAREITLSRLTRDEVKQWLEAAFHRQQVGREFLAFLYRHTEGDPFFITQLLRTLVEEGAIWHNGSRWEWSPVSELRLPAGRHALIAQRLSRFSSSTQAVLGTAAILGREFDVGLLVAASAGSEPAVKLAISEGVSAGLIRPTLERRQANFAFAHDEIAEVLVEGLPRAQIKHLHGRAAQSLEKRRPDRLGEIALHYDAAGEADDAYRTAQIAARAAERVYAQSGAGAYLQIAARNATTPAELAEIRIALAHVAETGGRHDEVEELCDLAIEWFEGQHDERRALTLRRIRERARMELGQSARASLDALVSLEADAQRLGFDRERIAVLIMESLAHSRLGDHRTAERLAMEAVEMSEQSADRQSLAESLNRLGSALAPEAPGRAHAAYARALELFEEMGDVRGQARCSNNMGITAQFEARLEEATAAFSKAISTARAAGMPDIWGLAALNLGVLLQKCGDYDRSRELFGEALALFAAVKHSEFQLAALFNMAHVERELGLWESAAALYDATTPLAQRIGQSDIELGAIAGAGLCWLQLGQIKEARKAHAEVELRMANRESWFQGREISEAFLIKIAAFDDRRSDALSRFERAVSLAESADLYNAAWLTVVCADSLIPFDGGYVEMSILRFGEKVKSLGYAEMTRRYEVLAGV
jgi:tetratricopeptide (TPR) repeat protein